MNKQPRSIVAFCMAVLAGVTLIALDASAQGAQPTDKAVRSFLHSIEHGKDSVDVQLYVTITQLDKIAGDAYQFMIRPSSIGGGDQSYADYALKKNYPDSRIGGVVLQKADSITFVSVTQAGFGNVWVTVDKKGRRFWRLTERFSERLTK